MLILYVLKRSSFNIIIDLNQENLLLNLFITNTAVTLNLIAHPQSTIWKICGERIESWKSFATIFIESVRIKLSIYMTFEGIFNRKTEICFLKKLYTLCNCEVKIILIYLLIWLIECEADWISIGIGLAASASSKSPHVKTMELINQRKVRNCSIHLSGILVSNGFAKNYMGSCPEAKNRSKWNWKPTISLTKWRTD